MSYYTYTLSVPQDARPGVYAVVFGDDISDIDGIDSTPATMQAWNAQTRPELPALRASPWPIRLSDEIWYIAQLCVEQPGDASAAARANARAWLADVLEHLARAREVCRAIVTGAHRTWVSPLDGGPRVDSDRDMQLLLDVHLSEVRKLVALSGDVPLTTTNVLYALADCIRGVARKGERDGSGI